MREEKICDKIKEKEKERRKEEKSEWGKEVRIYALINSYFTFLNLSSN